MSAISKTQILSIKDEHTLCWSNVLIIEIELCNSSANSRVAKPE